MYKNYKIKFINLLQIYKFINFFVISINNKLKKVTILFHNLIIIIISFLKFLLLIFLILSISFKLYKLLLLIKNIIFNISNIYISIILENNIINLSKLYLSLFIFIFFIIIINKYINYLKNNNINISNLIKFYIKLDKNYIKFIKLYIILSIIFNLYDFSNLFYYFKLDLLKFNFNNENLNYNNSKGNDSSSISYDNDVNPYTKNIRNFNNFNELNKDEKETYLKSKYYDKGLDHNTYMLDFFLNAINKNTNGNRLEVDNYINKDLDTLLKAQRDANLKNHAIMRISPFLRHLPNKSIPIPKNIDLDWID